MADGLISQIAQGSDPFGGFLRVQAGQQNQERLNILGQQEQRLGQAQDINIEAAKQKAVADQRTSQLEGVKAQQDVLIKMGRTEDAMRLMPDVFKLMGTDVPFDVEKLIEADRTKKLNFSDLLNKTTGILQDPKSSPETKQIAGKTLMGIISEAGKPAGQIDAQPDVQAPQVAPQAQATPQDRIRAARSNLLNIQQQFPNISQSASGQAAIKTLEDSIKFEESQIPKTGAATSRFKDKLEASRAALAVELGREPNASEVLNRAETLISETPEEAEDKARRKAEVKRVGDLRVKLPQTRNSLKALERQWKVVENTIDEAVKIISPFTSGVGSVFSVIPATTAKTLSGKLNTIRANVGFDKLQNMRDNSPTGGALGQVSEFENVLLQSVLGSLDQSLEVPELVNNLNIVKENIANIRSDRNESFNLDFQEVLSRGKESKQLTGQTTSGGNRFTVEEQ